MKKQKVNWLRMGKSYDSTINSPYYEEGYLAVRVFEKLSLKLRLKMCWKVLTSPRVIGIVKDSTIVEKELKEEIQEYEYKIEKLERNLERIQNIGKKEVEE